MPLGKNRPGDSRQGGQRGGRVKAGQARTAYLEALSLISARLPGDDTAVLREILDLIRVRERRREVDLGSGLESVPVPEEQPAGAREQALRDALAIALRELSEADRRILLSGLTESELSRELNMRPGAIRARRLRSRRKLRELLRAMGHGG